MKFKVTLIVKTKDKKFEEDEDLMEDLIRQILDNDKEDIEVESSYAKELIRY